MIYYLLLLLSPVVSCGQYVAQKQYNLKTSKPNVILFSAFTSFIALLFFILTSGFNFDFNIKLVPYALSYAIAYAAAYVGTVLAIRYGPMAMASLILSFTLVFPTFYGVIVRGDELGTLKIIGLIFLFVALILRSDSAHKISVKWLICVLVAFLGNGVCGISTNMQVDFVAKPAGMDYKHEFMIIALSVSTLVLFVYGLISSKNIKKDLSSCSKYATLNGVSNALVNLITLTLIGNIPNTVLYPTSSGLGMVVTFLLCYLIYKERFSKKQYIGYAFGVVSVILLNI